MESLRCRQQQRSRLAPEGGGSRLAGGEIRIVSRSPLPADGTPDRGQQTSTATARAARTHEIDVAAHYKTDGAHGRQYRQILYFTDRDNLLSRYVTPSPAQPGQEKT
jgi:hypothetical protein